MPWISMHSPVDDLTIHEQDGKIVALDWGWAPECPEPVTPLLEQAKTLLEDYFDGEEVDFSTLPYNPYGTDFQRKVWQIMTEIPFGQTLSYKDISDKLNSAPRAVGQACGRNPIPLLIPCHRVLASGGKLGGYSGGEGPETKEFLLTLEGVLEDDPTLL